jgi:hypothetical protein
MAYKYISLVPTKVYIEKDEKKQLAVANSYISD